MTRMTVGDLLKLPDAIMDELDARSRDRAEVHATKLINRLTGSNTPISPYNRYAQSEYNDYSSNDSSSSHYTENSVHLSEFLDFDIYKSRR